jgi:hypothetical protein
MLENNKINCFQFFEKIWVNYIMSAWSDLIKKLVKENPGTPLNTILPMAKKIYRKPDKQLNFPKPKNMTYNKRNRGHRGTRRKRR